MNRDVLEFIIIGCGVLWFVYKYVRTKKPKDLLTAAILVFLQLSWWPLYLPTKCSFGLIACTAAGVLIYHTATKKKVEYGYLYAFLFVIFGLAFLVDAYFQYFHGV